MTIGRTIGRTTGMTTVRTIGSTVDLAARVTDDPLACDMLLDLERRPDRARRRLLDR